MKVNGIEINSVYFNGALMSAVFGNGVEVFSAAPADAWYNMEFTIYNPNLYSLMFEFDSTIKYQKNDGPIVDLDTSNSKLSLGTPATGDVIRIAFQNCTKFSFYSVSDNSKGIIQDVTINSIANLTDMSKMFYGCSNLKKVFIEGMVNYTGSLYQMYTNCSNMGLCYMDDLSNATSTGYLFQNCSSLVGVSKLDLSSSTHIGGIFYNCSSLLLAPDIVLNPACTTKDNFFINCANLFSVRSITKGSLSLPSSFFPVDNYMISPNRNEQSSILNSGTDWVGDDLVIRTNNSYNLTINFSGTISVDITASWNTTPNYTTYTSTGVSSVEIRPGGSSGDYTKIRFTDVDYINFNTGNNNQCMWTTYLLGADKIKNHTLANFLSSTSVPILYAFNSDTITDFSNMFINASSLMSIRYIDTTNATNVTGMFSGTDASLTAPNSTEQTAIASVPGILYYR